MYNWNFGFTRYFGERLGATVDGRGYYGTPFISPIQNAGTGINKPAISFYSAMGGPTYRFYIQPKYSVSGRVMAGQLEKKVDPVYPVDSIAVDARGDVVLLATIKKTGEVGDVQAVSGPYRFRDAAIDAVKQWRYRPYEVDGAAVDVQATITLNFAPPPLTGR